MRCIARYEVVAGDFPTLDRTSGLAVPTDEPMDTLVVAVRALQESFRAAGVTAVGLQLTASNVAAVGRAELHVEAVPA